MPSPIESAKADLEKKEAIARSLHDEIAQIKAFIAMYSRYASDAALPTTSRASDSRPKKEIIGDGVSDILTSHGPYCSIQFFLEQLKINGIEVGTNNEKQALSSMLGRDGRFKFTHGKGWSFSQHEEGSGNSSPEPSNVGVAGSPGGGPHQATPVGSIPTTSTSVSAAEDESPDKHLFGNYQPSAQGG